jgi:RNA-directed DNA polymerase
VSLTTPESIRRLQRKLYVKAKREPEFRFYQLYDKVYRLDILHHAYRLAKSNGGSPGVDGVTFEDIEAQGVEEWLLALHHDLHAKTYRPSPVRRVMIEKPGGGERPLGIPTIRDRVAQTAAKLVIEPIFEADFEDCAHGYRPKHSAQGAVAQVHQHLCRGYTDVVDADLSKFFDMIPHHDLMQSVARRISDRSMLRLIKMWLKTPVEERDADGTRRLSGGKSSKQGTPQGGVISPLLANIYMHRFLRAWRQRGLGRRFRAHIVNYADDFVILSRGCAEEALAWTRWAMERIGLRLNETKTRICDGLRERFDFLGYTFGPERYRKDGHWYLAAQASHKSVLRVKTRLRSILSPWNKDPWPAVATEVNRVLHGWANYFSYGTRLMAYRAIDNYVCRRTQGFLRRRHKVQSQGTSRWPDTVIFGELGILRLRSLHLGPRR